MENILVLSDIHYKSKYAFEVLKAHPECQTVIFLGDGTRYVELLKQEAPEKAYIAVNGNCDSGVCISLQGGDLNGNCTASSISIEGGSLNGNCTCTSIECEVEGKIV